MIGKMAHLKIAFLFLLAAWFVMATGCGDPPEEQNGGNKKIRLQLNWFPDAQHGGFYAALINGHFSKEGLDVEIIPGGPGATVEAKVDLGRVEFGVANAHRIMLIRQNGANIKAVFASFQDSPRCIMVHRESGIESFEDLEGVTLAVGKDSAFYLHMEKKLDLKNVKMRSYSGSNAAFLQDKSYAQQAYSFSEPILVKRKGADPVTLMLSDLGFNPYTSCLFTSDKYIEENREIVAAMVRATQKGWEDYLNDPEPANKEMEKLNREHDLAALNEGAAAAKPLCRPTQSTVPIGNMDPKRWEELTQQLIDIGLLPADPRDGLPYSLEFLPKE